MGIFQLDLTIKTAIELGLEDMRNNPWLLDHMLEDTIKNPYLREKYGQKQIDACKEWFLNNQIDIYMRDRDDKDRFPCITIAPGLDDEKDDMKHMADLSTETITLMPNQIGKPIPFVVKPFTPDGYDQDTGMVSIPDVPGADAIAPGMILVNPSNGEGFVIREITPEGVMIDAGLDFNATQLAVVPQYQYYEARIEHAFFQLSTTVGCHVHGDPQALLWLHSIVKTALLRYKEGLFEAQGFSQMHIASGEMMEDPSFSGPGGEKSYMRKISLSGMIEDTWIKTPRRFIETAVLKEKFGDSFTGGIKILSNLDTPDFIDKSQESWTTVDEEESDSDDSED